MSVLGPLMETWPASSLPDDDPHRSFTHEVIFLPSSVGDQEVDREKEKQLLLRFDFHSHSFVLL